MISLQQEAYSMNPQMGTAHAGIQGFAFASGISAFEQFQQRLLPFLARINIAEEKRGINFLERDRANADKDGIEFNKELFNEKLSQHYNKIKTWSMLSMNSDEYIDANTQLENIRRGIDAEIDPSEENKIKEDSRNNFDIFEKFVKQVEQQQAQEGFFDSMLLSKGTTNTRLIENTAWSDENIRNMLINTSEENIREYINEAQQIFGDIRGRTAGIIKNVASSIKARAYAQDVRHLSNIQGRQASKDRVIAMNNLKKYSRQIVDLQERRNLKLIYEELKRANDIYAKSLV